jgi:hypothetical protein
VLALPVLDVRLPAASPADLARIAVHLGVRLRSGPVAVVVCHGEALPGELASVDALARLALVARRCGTRLAVRGARPELAALVELLGLGELLAAPTGRAPR